MTTEKMTVHKALCELKTLDARIQKSIQQGTFVFANKHSNNKVAGVSIGTYSEEIRVAYQSAKDLQAIMAVQDRLSAPVGTMFIP